MLKKTVRIINKTNGQILANKAEIANTHLSRLKGLLGKEGLNQGQGLIIEPCDSIHTFFMKFSIDVVFVNGKNEVVKLAENLPPGKLFGALFKAQKVVELPAGSIRLTGTKVNDYIEIIHQICP